MSIFHTKKVIFNTDRVFQPQYNVRLLTDKFYSRLEPSKELARIPYYEQELEKRIRYDARDNFLAPITTNQVYGWLERLAVHYVDEKDKFILEHKRFCPPDLKVLQQVYMEDKIKKA